MKAAETKLRTLDVLVREGDHFSLRRDSSAFSEEAR